MIAVSDTSSEEDNEGRARSEEDGLNMRFQLSACVSRILRFQTVESGLLLSHARGGHVGVHGVSPVIALVMHLLSPQARAIDWATKMADASANARLSITVFDSSSSRFRRIGT